MALAGVAVCAEAPMAQDNNITARGIWRIDNGGMLDSVSGE
jgi:hypothetical protein